MIATQRKTANHDSRAFCHAKAFFCGEMWFALAAIQ
jgi:hypothetical protein